MRPLDLIRGAWRGRRDLAEVRDLQARLRRHAEGAEARRDELCVHVLAHAFDLGPDDAVPAVAKAAWLFCQALLDFEGHLRVPDADLTGRSGTAALWEAKAALSRALDAFERPDQAELVAEVLVQVVRAATDGVRTTEDAQDDDGALAVPIADLMRDPHAGMGTVMAVLTDAEHAAAFPTLRERLLTNLYAASGIDDPGRSTRSVRWPEDRTDLPASRLAETYFRGTPLAALFATELPFTIPFRTRFEHTHVLGGSGHGKTQLLQQMLLRDIDALCEGKGSLIVIDSQGDMLRNITHLAELSPEHAHSLAHRVVLIDPNDIEHPPALNLFDFGLDRLDSYAPAEREKLVNGAIALYEYLFGALLGAELTQRQGVIFRYLARLLMTVPGATIHTLREFMEEPEAVRPHLGGLDPTARRFFETQFFSISFNDTRQQILTRLWGVLSNRVLERMFSNERNKLDLFEAMNRGSIILINTAKDLLKQEGCEILGRFFIALICQAAQERASIPEERRRSTFLYVDEAQDYFDESVEQLLNQARKYKVGIILAHQNLDQFETRLRSAVMASTATKIVGGVSAKDAAALGREMRCDPEFLQGMRKSREQSEFACFVRNVTARPVRLMVPFGQMERRPKLSGEKYEALIERNRARYAADGSEASAGIRQRISAASGFRPQTPEML